MLFCHESQMVPSTRFTSLPIQARRKWLRRSSSSFSMQSGRRRRANARGPMSTHARSHLPVVFALDELPNLAPIPGLDGWMSQGAGLGLKIVGAVQSRQQLFDRWGPHAARTIWENVRQKLVSPGSSDLEMLRELSELTGEQMVQTQVTTVGNSQGTSPGVNGEFSNTTSNSSSTTWQQMIRPVRTPYQLHRGEGDSTVVLFEPSGWFRVETPPFFADPLWQRGLVMEMALVARAGPTWRALLPIPPSLERSSVLRSADQHHCRTAISVLETMRTNGSLDQIARSVASWSETCVRVDTPKDTPSAPGRHVAGDGPSDPHFG